MNTNKKFYFISPEINFPSGGVDVIHRYCDILNRNGFDSYVVYKTRNFKYRWTIKSDYIKYKFLEDGIILDADDVLLIPEPNVDLMASTKDMNCKKVVFNQNWGFEYTFYGFAQLNDNAVRKYQHLNYNNVLTVTSKIKEYLDFSMNSQNDLNIHVAHPYLTNSFIPLDIDKKDLAIGFMPRKKLTDFQNIVCQFKALEFDATIVPIQGMREKQVSEIMQRVSIFLSLGYPEGLSLPPLEAMKSGCIVIGYSGYGGLEYMKNYSEETPDGNMFLFADGDNFGMAKKIKEVYEDLQNKNFDKYRPMIENAIKTASEFTIEKTTEKLIQFANTI